MSTMYTSKNKRPVARTVLVMILLAFAAPAAAGTMVSIGAPEFVSGTFDVEIGIKDVENLKSGHFNLSFDPYVVEPTVIRGGEIGGVSVMADGSPDDSSPINITVSVAGGGGANGDGSLATVRFRAVGADDASTSLNLSDGNLTNVEGDRIYAEWTGGKVTIKSLMTHVYVKNLDDDRLDVYLYIDNDFKQFEDRISSGATQEFGSYKLSEGVHSFRIGWFDPDTEKWYNDTATRSISGSVATAVVLHADEHDEDEDKISAHVYVKNLDGDCLDVDLYIDDDFTERETISSGDTGDFGLHEFEKDEVGSHSFKIKWQDPGTEEEYEKISRHYIDNEEAVTIFIDPHTRIAASSIYEESSEVPAPDLALFSASASSPSSSPAPSAQSPSPSSSSSASSASAEVPQSSDTTFHTKPVSSNTRDDRFGYYLVTAYILIGLVAVLFAMSRFRRP
ncbi:MAG: cohesin domain-containing protein [Euryarchaeota archaeon]|nr:cohesin domain-containing protein [Euryarchaeota archaeon]